MVLPPLSNSLAGIFAKVSKSVPFQATLCFFGLYSFLLIFAVPLTLLFVYRLFLSFIFKFFYNGKIKLANGYDALMGNMDSFGSVANITAFIYVNGSCDIEKLLERVSKKILAKDENGNRPYDVLLDSTQVKFGFTCLIDKSSEIDFQNHVKLCPGLDPCQVHTEQEFLEAVAKLADYEWDDDGKSKPKWEILVTPQLKREGSEEISYGIAVKFHHIYVDGISLVQFVRNCVFDQPAPKLALDPVHPPFPPLPLYKRIFLGLQIFFLGPYISLRLMAHDYDPVFYEGPLVGGKLFGRTKMNISLEMMRRIRKFHKCTTQAVLHSAFVGSFQKMAKRKGISLPDQITASVVSANFPYPDEYPRNNACFAYETLTGNNANPLSRLAEFNKSMMALNRRTYAIQASWFLSNLLGMYPAAAIRYSTKFFKCAYYISNVPGMEETGKIGGNDVALVFGVGPLCLNIRYHAGIGFYGGNFCVGLHAENSSIIRDMKEMEKWVREFENEIRYLDARANANIMDDIKLSTSDDNKSK